MATFTTIREFDSKPTEYKLEDGKIWERTWNRFEGYYRDWTLFLEGDDVQKYWTALQNCVTRDVTDQDYDESKFEV